MLIPQRQAGCQRGVTSLYNSCQQGGEFASDSGAVRATHTPLNELAQATPNAHPKERMELLEAVPLLIIDDLGMRKPPLTDAQETAGDRHATR